MAKRVRFFYYYYYSGPFYQVTDACPEVFDFDVIENPVLFNYSGYASEVVVGQPGTDRTESSR